MSKKELIRFAAFLILPITIITVAPYPSFHTAIIARLVNTTVMMFTSYATIIIYFIVAVKLKRSFNSPLYYPIKLFLLYNFLQILRGFFIAKGYWDLKYLMFYTPALLLPVIVFVCESTNIISYLLRLYVKIVLPLFVIFAFLIRNGAYGQYLMGVSFFLLFLPILSKKYRILFLFLALLVFTVNLGARSNVIKFAVPILLSSLYFFRKLPLELVFKYIRRSLLLIPIILFILSVKGIFNPFDMDSYVSYSLEYSSVGEGGKEQAQSLTTDTRTFLYFEVLHSARKYNYWWFGRSPARGNESATFKKASLHTVGRSERIMNEVGILNVFTWTGVFGVVMYFIIFAHASWLAISRSNNVFSKILGIFIAFRWFFAWIEDINMFNLNYFFLWIEMGLCYSSEFRNMTNNQVKEWIQRPLNTPIFTINR